MTGSVADGLGTYEILDPATAAPERTYSDTEAVQYVVLPGGCDQELDVTSELVPAQTWDGSSRTGGVIFLGGSTLNLAADINASAAGFSSFDSVGAGCDGGSGQPQADSSMWSAGGGGGGVIGGGGGASGHIGNTDFATDSTFDGSPGGGGTSTTGGAGGEHGEGFAEGSDAGGAPVQEHGVAPDGGDAGCVGNGGSLDQGSFFTGFWSTGAGGGGGGSYGGGGAGCSARSSAAYAAGGGGGGSYTGGGAGGAGGTNTGAAGVNPEENGVAGNSAVAAEIPDTAHFLNHDDPRLMMGGAGGASFIGDGSSPQNGGRGGGIVVLDFDSVVGSGGSIVSNGGDGATPPNFSSGAQLGSSGSGGGAGGQIAVMAPTVSSLNVSAVGGIGGDAVEDTGSTSFLRHTGSAGATGGGGGIWFAEVGGDTTNSGNNAGATSAESTIAAPGLSDLDWAVNAGNPGLNGIYPSPVTVGSATFSFAEWASLVGAANADSSVSFKWIAVSMVDASGGAFDLTELLDRFPSLSQPNNPKNAGLGCTPGLGGTGLMAFSSPPVPDLEIETTTLGVDSDLAPGETLVTGQAVTWEYEVTAVSSGLVENIVVTDSNLGVAICPETTLAVGESMTCSLEGTVVDGEYATTGTVTGDGIDVGLPTIPVLDSDPTHHVGVSPAIDIEATTNEVQADDDPSENPVAIGDGIEWSYLVTNGDIPVVDIVIQETVDVSNDQPSPTELFCDYASSSDPTTGEGELAANETLTCSATGVAGSGPYKNVASVTGNAAELDTETAALVAVLDSLGAEISVTDFDYTGYVGEPTYDLALAEVISDISPSPEGRLVEFTITVANQGELASDAFEVTSELDPGTEFVSASDEGSEVSPGIVEWQIPEADSLESGETLDLTLTVRITDPEANGVLNTSEISADSGDDTDSTPDAIITGPESDNLVDITDVADLAIDTGTDTPDEDDHDVAQLGFDYDLALVKTINSTSDRLVPDGTVTFDLSVTNQGEPVERIAITDYIDTTKFDVLTIDKEMNATGTATGDARSEFGFAWEGAGTATPRVLVTPTTAGDKLGTGETLTIPITLAVAADWDGSDLDGWAEISMFDDDETSENGDSNNAGTGTRLFDKDSTPDAEQTNDAQPSGYGEAGDDVIDNEGGDEDDHDVAGLPIYDLSLINDLAATQDYAIDPTAEVLEADFIITVKNQGNHPVIDVDVTQHLPEGTVLDEAKTDEANAEVAGLARVGQTFQLSEALQPGDTVDIAVALTVVDPTIGSYLSSAEISAAFDLNGTAISDIDSAVDAAVGNDVVESVVSEGDPIEINSHDDIDNDRTETGAPISTPLDDDDHGQEEVVVGFDQAVEIQFAPEAATYPLEPGSDVTFEIVVTNQGSAIEQISIVDYVDVAVWEAFDASLNPEGTTGGDVALPYAWTADDTAPVVAIEGSLGLGETLTIPVTLSILDDYVTSLGELVNTVEIASFDDDLDDADEAPIDVDSTPDTENTDPESEDDHDSLEVAILDLALREVLDPAVTQPVQPGQDITFQIEVINQGSVAASNIEVIDYVDPEMWAPFDSALNPASDDYVWAADGTDARATLVAELAPGDSITIPVVLTVAEGADLSELSNTSEIAAATATTGGEVVVNPDGSPVTDFDSTADVIDDDVLVDNVTDNADGDEDDHDIAIVEPPLFSLGNQVWEDTNDDGVFDADELPIPTVDVHLFVDGDSNGIADDIDGNGTLDSADALSTTVTGAEGEYLFSDLPVGDYVVGIAPTNFADDGILFNSVSSVVTVADPNSDLDGDDNGEPCVCPDGYVLSGPVSLAGAEPTEESGLVNDPVTVDANSNLTVDFGFWFPELDVELDLEQISTGTPTVGDTVEFELKLTNTGTAALTGDLVLVLSENASFDSTTIPVVDSGEALMGIDDALAPGAFVAQTLAVFVSDEGTVDMSAMLEDAVLMDGSGVPMVNPSGQTLSVSFDESIDVEVLGQVLAPPASTTDAVPAALAFTGSTAGRIVTVALMLMALGAAILFRRRQLEILHP